MTPIGFSEDSLIEQPAVNLLAGLGWQTCNIFAEFEKSCSSLGYDNKAEVALNARSYLALEVLDDNLLPETFEQIIEDLTCDNFRSILISGEKDVSELDINTTGEQTI